MTKTRELIIQAMKRLFPGDPLTEQIVQNATLTLEIQRAQDVYDELVIRGFA